MNERQWTQTIATVFLGFLTVVAVLGVSQLLKKSEPDRPAMQSESLTEQVRRLKEDIDVHDQAIARRLDHIESTVRDLQQRITALDAIVSRPRQKEPSRADEPVSSPPPVAVAPTPESNTVASSGPVQEALTSAWQYIAKREFDPKQHNRVLEDLVAAYMLEGLSPEVNSSLLATIQQVNEMGVSQIISEVRSLPASDAVQRLRTFLDTTPKLTHGQTARINSTLAAYSNARGSSPQTPNPAIETDAKKPRGSSPKRYRAEISSALLAGWKSPSGKG